MWHIGRFLQMLSITTAGYSVPPARTTISKANSSKKVFHLILIERLDRFLLAPKAIGKNPKMEYLLLEEEVEFEGWKDRHFYCVHFRLGDMSNAGFSLGQPLLGIDMNYRGLSLGKLFRGFVPGSKVHDHQRSNFPVGFLEAIELDRELGLVPINNLNSQGK